MAVRPNGRDAGVCWGGELEKCGRGTAARYDEASMDQPPVEIKNFWAQSAVSRVQNHRFNRQIKPKVRFSICR